MKKNTTSRTYCIALATGYADNTSMSWLFFTHHKGFDTKKEALKDLARELVSRYTEKRTILSDEAGVEFHTGFIMYVNSLSRGSWGDYGDPDTAGLTKTVWWPFTEFHDVISLKQAEVVSIQTMGAEVLLAAYDPAMLQEFDTAEIFDRLPEIASVLGLVKEEKFENLGAVGTA